MDCARDPETGPERQRLGVGSLRLVHELADLFVDQPGMERGVAGLGQPDQACEKALIGGNAEDRGLVQRTA
jgi:hypothetical protein